MSQLTTHILDTTRGKPAAGVKVILFIENGDQWVEVAMGETNNDGRIPDLLSDDVKLSGIYKLKFEVSGYFKKLGTTSFYPYVEIVFEINSADHYHVPLLLNPFGYSTYRGS